MIIIKSNSNNPYFNIAAEEYLFSGFTDDICFLYINEPSVIVGKHQNAFAEINNEFARKNNIPLIRRLSGGGTVYHDTGNINFCFIVNGRKGSLIDFSKYTQPIINVLKTLGVNVHIGHRNNLFIGDKKVSGNAEYSYRNRVLHHGTLLFDSNLDNLEKSIDVTLGKFSDKAVQSVRSTVTNISQEFDVKLSSELFFSKLVGLLTEELNSTLEYSLNNDDIKEIEKLIETKYSQWSWNYGESPKFSIDVLINENSAVTVKVVKGLIVDCASNNVDIQSLRGCIIGKKYSDKFIKNLPFQLEYL